MKTAYDVSPSLATLSKFDGEIEDIPMTLRAFAIMDGTGDTKCTWDPTKPVEVENARKTFDELRAKGYSAFRVEGRDSSKGEEIRKFDPDAAMMILAPPLRGGR